MIKNVNKFYSEGCLNAQKVDALRTIAKELGIKRYSKMCKADLIANILQAQKTENAANEHMNDACKECSDNTGCCECPRSSTDDHVTVLYKPMTKPSFSGETRTRESYINNVQNGSIIAFAITAYPSDSRAMSGKVYSVVKNNEGVVQFVFCESKAGTRFKVPASRILWVKTGRHWPRAVYNRMKNSKGSEKNGCK